MSKTRTTDSRPISIFTLISYLTDKKRPWEDLTDEEKKLWVVFLGNKILSMNSGFIEMIAEFQKYTVGVLTPEITYKLYLDLLPAQRQFNKYIKSTKAEKYNDELVNLMSNHYKTSKQEAIENLEIFFHSNLDGLKEIIKMYAKTPKEIEKLITTKK